MSKKQKVVGKLKYLTKLNIKLEELEKEVKAIEEDNKQLLDSTRIDGKKMQLRFEV